MMGARKEWTGGLRPAAGSQRCAVCGRAWGRAAQTEGAASTEAGPFGSPGVGCPGLGERGRSGEDHTGLVVGAEEVGEPVEDLGDE